MRPQQRKVFSVLAGLLLLTAAVLAVNFYRGASSTCPNLQPQAGPTRQDVAQFQNFIATLYAFDNPSTAAGQNYTLSHPFSVTVPVAMRTGYTVCSATDTTANRGLLADGMMPSCLTQCSGILYFKDPTTVITNEGHDYIQYMLSGSAHSVTPGTTDRAKVLGVSTSNSTALVTDTYAGSGPCSSGTILTTSGFAAVAGTVTAGTPSAGSVTWTIVTTFTSSGYKTISAGCLLTATSGSIYIFGESSGVGHFGIPSGDTLSETWQVTAS